MKTKPRGISRRKFVGVGAAAAGLIAATPKVARASHVTLTPTSRRPGNETEGTFSAAETVLAFRCHGFPLEHLRETITPIGEHFVLMHFDIPRLDAATHRVSIGGRVSRPMTLNMKDIRSRPQITEPVIMECAGNGRSLIQPRAIYVPWFVEAIGNYEYTGTPLGPILQEAGLLPDAREVVFTGVDEGLDLGFQHPFQRSLSIEEAMRPGVMLAYEHNGVPLLPKHGFPLRLIVPNWYGMTSVKWLRSIEVINEPFLGVQQSRVYRFQLYADDPGIPVQRKTVRSLLMPPGMPDLITRHRFVQATRSQPLQGMAWSGNGSIVRVEVSTTGGKTWQDATLGPAVGPFSWTPFTFNWTNVTPGEYQLTSRATDSAGNTQPIEPVFNFQGMTNNSLYRVPVTVGNAPFHFSSFWP
jgi:DMSO/TMAO reductase YedYZ molybdopterin-dependent catalytic subunit